MDKKELINPLPSESDLFTHIGITISTVWGNNISKNDIEEWLTNFTGEIFDCKYERQLALFLLAHFVYYNEKNYNNYKKYIEPII